MILDSPCNCSFCRNGAGGADSPDPNALAIVPYVTQTQQAPTSSSTNAFQDCNALSSVCVISLYAYFLLDGITYGSGCLMWNEFLMEWSLQNVALRHTPITCRNGKLWCKSAHHQHQQTLSERVPAHYLSQRSTRRSKSAQSKTYPLKLPKKNRGIARCQRTWPACKTS